MFDKTKLKDNIYLYTFNGKDELNVLGLLNDDKALLIDSGYPSQAKALKKELEEDNIKPEILINSHYHPDHVNGNFHFKGCKLMASEHYKMNYELFSALYPTVGYVEADELIKDGNTLNFGQFELKFYNYQGHSQDSLVIVINDQLAHIGDLIMMTNDGKYRLPYMSFDGNIDDYVKSLKALKKLQIPIFIPGHGQILDNQESTDKAIDFYNYYLEQFKHHGKQATVENCLGSSRDKCVMLEYHDRNIKNIFRD